MTSQTRSTAGRQRPDRGAGGAFVPSVSPRADAETRVERFARGGDLAAVARLLGARREEILRRWLSAAGLQPFLKGLAERAVDDHIPALFDALVALLERSGSRLVDAEPPMDDPAVLHAAEAHARARLDQGLRPTDVVTEFRLLRQEVGRALRLALGDGTHILAGDVVAAELLVHDALDGAIGLALTALTAHADQAVTCLRDQLGERDHLAAESEANRRGLQTVLASEREAHTAADAATAWADFMAQAGSLLAESLDVEATLASIARLAVPRLADWCGVYVVGEDGEPRRLAAAHVDPEKDALMHQLLRFPVAADPTHPVRRAMATRRPVIAPPPAEGAADRYATGDEHASMLRGLGTGGALIVPFVARGQPVGAISVGRSDDAPVERALIEDLARRAALAVENARLHERVQEALRTRDAFLASAAHDLKTPLASLKGTAQLLHRQLVSHGDHGASDVPAAEVDQLLVRLTRIDADVNRMTAMIDELLDLARLQAGELLRLNRQSTDLVALVRQRVAEHQRGTSAHEIRIEAADQSLEGEWDEARLERLLDNLLSNAIKYSPGGGGITVAVWRKEAHDSPDGPWAVLSVADHGMGIPAADRGRVFERFRRAANVAEGGIRGTGLGLASARHIAEQHGGTITVESREGSGSTFTVRLPLREPAAPRVHRRVHRVDR